MQKPPTQQAAWPQLSWPCRTESNRWVEQPLDLHFWLLQISVDPGGGGSRELGHHRRDGLGVHARLCLFFGRWHLLVKKIKQIVLKWDKKNYLFSKKLLISPPKNGRRKFLVNNFFRNLNSTKKNWSLGEKKLFLIFKFLMKKKLICLIFSLIVGAVEGSRSCCAVEQVMKDFLYVPLRFVLFMFTLSI